MNTTKTGNEMGTKVYSYARFSGKKQAKGQTVERQSNYAEVFAREHGLTLDTALSMFDKGLSAYHERHVKTGALGVFLKTIDDGKVEPGSILIVEGLDRLSRAEPLIAQAQLSQIINAGVTVVTAADNKTYSRESIKDNPMDLIYSLLVMIRAHEESDTKSKRAKSAIESQCKRWNDGSFRGCIRVGKDPAWVKWNNETRAFELVEPEASKMRRIVQLHLQGYGGFRIAQTITKEGFPCQLKARSYMSISEGLRSRAHLLIGTRIVNAGGTEYRLDGYYPALIDQTEYNEIVSGHHKPAARGRAASVPSIFTGYNSLFRCGYCGCCVNIDRDAASRNGKPGSRRARCDNGNDCRTGSCLLNPLEKAVMSWCSDQMNLNSLVGNDRSAEIKSRLAASRGSLREQQKQLERIMDAMLSTDSPPAVFATRARTIESQIATINHAIRTDEAALLAESNAPTVEAAEIWASLATAAMNDDIDARMAVRKLVGDTFKNIVLYRHGVTPPPVEQTKFHKDQFWELALVSKSGITRQLRIDRNGDVIACVDFSAQLAAA